MDSDIAKDGLKLVADAIDRLALALVNYTDECEGHIAPFDSDTVYQIGAFRYFRDGSVSEDGLVWIPVSHLERR